MAAVEDDDLSALLSDLNSTYDDSTVDLFDEASVVLSESVQTAAIRTEPSPEEVAWADSCIDIALDFSDDQWSAMRDAFLEALSSFPTSYETSLATHADETFGETEESDAENDSQSEDTRAALIHPELEKHHSYDESQRETQGREGLTLEDSSGSQEDIDLPETIFKVWDLEIPETDDEDELIQQLKKLLASSSQEILPPPPDSSTTNFSQEDVQELVTSMGNLSL